MERRLLGRRKNGEIGEHTDNQVVKQWGWQPCPSLSVLVIDGEGDLSVSGGKRGLLLWLDLAREIDRC